MVPVLMDQVLLGVGQDKVLRGLYNHKSQCALSVVIKSCGTF